jgi:translocation and assembly module TamB
MQSRTKRILIKIFKVAGWITISIILLLVTIALLIQIPAVQLKLTQKAVSFLEDNIGTEVSLESIHITFPKNIVLEGIYLEDQQGDTLLYAQKFSINTNLWALAKNEIQLNDISLKNAVAFISRAENDNTFNFTYILEAFAGDSTAVPDTLEQKNWDFSLETISLQNIRLEYQDLLKGNLADLSLGNFEITMDVFDLKNNTFGVEEILLTDTRANIQQTKPRGAIEKTEEDSSATLLFTLEELTMANVYARYEQSALGQLMQVDLGEAKVNVENISLGNQEIDLNQVALKQTFFAYQQGAIDTILLNAEKNKPADEPALEKNLWKISVDALDFEDNSLQYDDLTKPQTKGAIDFDHLWITHFNIDAGDIMYSSAAIQANLHDLSFQEKSGFSIQSFESKILVTETSAALNDFLLLTGNSRLHLQAKAGFSSFAHIADDYPQAAISTDIHSSFINVRDILYFIPGLLDSLPLNLPGNTNLHIDAAMNGRINNLHINHLVFQLLSDTYLRTSGTLSGLPDAKNMRMNIALEKFYTTKSDMHNVLPDTLLPDSIALPAWLNLEGTFQGTTEKATFSTLLTSNVGAIDLKGGMNLDSTSALRGYDANIVIDDLNTGKILMKPDSIMGKLAMTVKFHSNGLSPNEMNSTVTALVNHFEYQGYRYEDLKLKAAVRNDIVSVEAAMAGKNLDFTLEGAYNYHEEVPEYTLTFDVKNADFHALNLSLSPLKARGTLAVNMATSDFKVLNGNVGIRNVAVFDGDDLYAVDSLLFASIDQEGKSEINIESDLLTASFEGSINIFRLPGVLREYFNAYYSLHDSLEVKDAGEQHFSFDIKIKNTELLTGLLIPQLTSFVPGEIKGEFNSETKQLDLRMEVNQIQYSNIGVRSFVFSTNSDPSSLHYNFMMDRVMVDSMRIDGVEFNGTVANDSIQTALIILDSMDVEKYVLAGTFFSRDEGFELRLLPGGIKLNYQNWSVPPDNFMRFGGENFIAKNVELVNGREKIIIESKEDPGSPVFIGFRKLNLEYLASVIAEEKPLSGLLEGDINLYPGSAGMIFTSDITIDNFSILEVPWGDLSLAVEQKIRNRFDINFRLTGNQNNLKAKGFYMGGGSPAIDLTANIERFNAASLQPLVSDQLKNLTGVLRGQIQVRGTPQKPDIDGSIRVNDTHFVSTYLNSSFAIDNETISFIDEGISFNAFQITDNDENEARLDGIILTNTYRDFQFNLKLITNHFRLLNTTREDNDLFYGRVDIEANARIRGTMATPIIDMQIGLSEGSHLTYIVPQSEASVLATEGIVKFVDKSFTGDAFMKKISREVSDTIKSIFTGIDLTAKIELSDQETFTIVIDPITQDQLTIRGNSTLTLQIDPTGDIHLTGRYEIAEGTYNLSFYKFVKREFAIEKGSTMRWTGDPLNPTMDIRAIYRVETAPIALFSNQLTGADATEFNRYKQTLPFLVYLNISGKLLQPEIGFQLEMPMDKRNVFGGTVYARIQDINTRESDLNKQVFALLILKRFIADNPFENQAVGGFESTARRSVSKILSEQLNRLSENIKGVELSFDIKSYEDYSTGEAEGQTELQLGLSKTLFDDRLVVKLSGNIDIEGENSNRDATDYIGDLAVEYKLTPDGRFRITGFRNSNYDMIDGELIETGVGLIYVKDYNSLSELFKANAETTD